MGNYSREAEHQSKALDNILNDRPAEKRIFVGGVDKEFKKELEKKELQERKDREGRTEVLKEARTPWFCPDCDKIMKKRIDSEYYRKFGHCLDCQVEFENKLAIAGKLNGHVEDAVKLNKKAYIKDLKQSIEEWKNSKDYVEFFNQVNPDGYTVETEKWNDNQQNMTNLIVEAEEYLQKLEESI
jgi:ribosomal protein L37AE/L43A